MKSGGPFFEVHGKSGAFVFLLHLLGQSLELVGAFFADAQVVVTADEDARLSDGEGGSGAIREGSADGSIGLFGPAPEFDFVFASPRDIDEPVAAFLRTSADLVLLIDEDIEPFGTGKLGRVFVLSADDDALFLVGQWANPFPPFREVIAELFDELGILIDDIAFLKRVGFEVVEFTVFEEAPTLVKHAGLIGSHLGLAMRRGIVREAGHAAVIHDEDALVGDLFFAAKNRSEVDAVELWSGVVLDFAQVE